MKMLSNDYILYCALNIYKRHLKGLDGQSARIQEIQKRIPELQKNLLDKER